MRYGKTALAAAALVLGLTANAGAEDKAASTDALAAEARAISRSLRRS